MAKIADSVEWMQKRWHEEGQPLPEHFAAMGALMRAHQSVISVAEKSLRAHGLSRNAYLLLSTLQVSREHTRSLSQLSRNLMVHQTTITQVIDQLEKKNFVLRKPHPTDRRTNVAVLTPEGLAATEKASQELAEVGYGMNGVSAQLAVTVTEILRQVREATGDIT